jgi:hypothetical protein
MRVWAVALGAAAAAAWATPARADCDDPFGDPTHVLLHQAPNLTTIAALVTCAATLRQR